MWGVYLIEKIGKEVGLSTLLLFASMKQFILAPLFHR